MKIAVRASLFATGFVMALMTDAPIAQAAPGKTINDSLVAGLSCSNLSVDSIYRAIREDAFAEDKNLDIVNWPFQSGGVTLANCWALSSTQRMFSYLARYGEKSQISKDARLELVMNMVERAIPVIVNGDSAAAASPDRAPKKGQRVGSSPLKNYSVFQVEGYTASSDYHFWWDLRAGYDMDLSGKFTVQRSFRKSIEANQVAHFYRMGNLGMGIGSGATSAKQNYETVKTLMKNAAGKRLTLINLRFARTIQHVVMVKSYRNTPEGDVIFKVYDSNQPQRDQDLIYQAKTGAIISFDIARAFYIPTKPVGAFIVDEQERADFEVAMLKYYRSICR